MRDMVVGRRRVLGLLGGLLGVGLGAGSGAALDRRVRRVRLRATNVRRSWLAREGGRPLRLLVGGIRGPAITRTEATLSVVREGVGTRTHEYQDGDDLYLRARQGSAGHELSLGPAGFRPEIGDEVIVEVRFFDEADALFGKGVLGWYIDGKGND